MQYDGLLKRAVLDGYREVICVDPGTTDSGVVMLKNTEEGFKIIAADKVSNSFLFWLVESTSVFKVLMLVEKIVLHSGAGAETASTIFASGNLHSLAKKSGFQVLYGTRSAVKKSLVNAVSGIKDKHIREKCILEFGKEIVGSKFERLGKGSKPGRLSKDMWSALALFLAYVADRDQFNEEY
jgi:hypothetical protein